MEVFFIVSFFGHNTGDLTNTLAKAAPGVSKQRLWRGNREWVGGGKVQSYLWPPRCSPSIFTLLWLFTYYLGYESKSLCEWTLDLLTIRNGRCEFAVTPTALQGTTQEPPKAVHSAVNIVHLHFNPIYVVALLLPQALFVLGGKCMMLQSGAWSSSHQQNQITCWF